MILKDVVTKYFDCEFVGIKKSMDNIPKLEMLVCAEILEEYVQGSHGMEQDVLLQWKDSYCALEKLTEGEASTVMIGTVAEENGFEEFRQLNVHFETELVVQNNIVLLELDNIAPATSIEGTKMKIVEIKVRIARAEDILGQQV